MVSDHVVDIIDAAYEVLSAREPDGHRRSRAMATKREFRRVRGHTMLLAVLNLIPLLAIALQLFLMFFLLLAPIPISNQIGMGGIHQITLNTTAPSSKTLPQLLGDIATGLKKNNITFWMLPGAGLLADNDARHARFTQWHEGVDIGIYQNDLLQLVVVQAELQYKGIEAVESYFGLRLFASNGLGNDQYDFKEPFVDVKYFKDKGDHIVNHCCDCAPVSIGSCTKKMCECLVCAAYKTRLFPLQDVLIEGVGTSIPGPKDFTSLLLKSASQVVHPLVYE